ANRDVRDLLSDRGDPCLRLRLLAVTRLIELCHAVRVMRGGSERRVVAIAPAIAQFVEINARLAQCFAQLAAVLRDRLRLLEMRRQGGVDSRFDFGGVINQAGGEREIVRSPSLTLILEPPVRPAASDADGKVLPLDSELEPVRIAPAIVERNNVNGLA